MAIGCPIFIIAEDGITFLIAEDSIIFIIAEQVGVRKIIRLDTPIDQMIDLETQVPG